MFAMTPAHTTAVAAKGINEGNFASCHKTYGTELTRRKASSATTADLLGGLGQVLSSKKKMKAVAIGQQSQAIGPIAVAQATDKGCFESPEGVH